MPWTRVIFFIIFLSESLAAYVSLPKKLNAKLNEKSGIVKHMPYCEAEIPL